MGKFIKFIKRLTNKGEKKSPELEEYIKHIRHFLEGLEEYHHQIKEEKARNLSGELAQESLQTIINFIENNEAKLDEVSLGYVLLVAQGLTTIKTIETFNKMGLIRKGKNCHDILEYYKTNVLDYIFEKNVKNSPKR